MFALIGIKGVNGDEFCRTNLPDVYAIGNCAAHANDYAERRGQNSNNLRQARDERTLE